MRKSFNSSRYNYESLDIDNNYPIEIVSNKMNNAIGFDHTRWFRIENVADNSVIFYSFITNFKFIIFILN